MRLTLRTLLAYRDRVLGVADTEDLHRRIQISQDAGNLLKRIGAVTKQNNLLAPPVLGKGLGGDPNSIAEYLDDALQHSQIPELERTCLVSDMQLAELADCHTMLSTAMNTKVTVPESLREIALAAGDPQLRKQVAAELEARKAPRRSGRRTNPALIETQGSASNTDAISHDVTVRVEAPMLASGGDSIATHGLDLETYALSHEVPEYLVGSSPIGNWRIPLAIGTLVTLLGLLVWQNLGPWDRVAELFANGPARTLGSSKSIDYDLITEAQLAPPGLSDATTAPPDNAAPNAASSASLEIESSDNMPPGAAAVAPTMTVDSQVPPGLDIVTDSTAPPGISTAPLGISESPPGIPPGTSNAPPGLGSALANGAASGTPAAARDLAAGSGVAIWLPRNAVEDEAVVLSEVNKKLQRVQAGEPIQVPSKLIIPPTTRTTIDLPGGVLWTACGPSILELAPARVGSAPVVVTRLCRSLIRGGPEGRQVVLATPAGEYLLELADATSLASIEFAYRPAKHGSCLDVNAMLPILVIVAAEGGVSIQAAGQPAKLKEQSVAPEKLALGEGLAVVAGSQPVRFRLQEIPAWYRTSIERPIDGLASEDLHRLLAATDPQVGLVPIIDDLTTHRRPETAAMAIQVALLSGNWQPLAEGFLGNERMRSHWSPTLQLARQCLASDPGAAPAAKQVFLQNYGDADGQLLYDLVCGLPEDQLGTEGLANLVQLLEHPRLDHRVLAAYQLYLFAGKNLGYQPTAPNRVSVQQWRRELATNRLAAAAIPDIIWERRPRQ